MEEKLYCVIIQEYDCEKEVYHGFFDHEPTKEDCVKLVIRGRFIDDYEPTQEELDEEEEDVSICEYYSFILDIEKLKKTSKRVK